MHTRLWEGSAKVVGVSQTICIQLINNIGLILQATTADLRLLLPFSQLAENKRRQKARPQSGKRINITSLSKLISMSLLAKINRCR